MLHILCVLAQVLASSALTANHSDSVILRDDISDYCQLKCGTQQTVYTLCEPIANASGKCSDKFELYDEGRFKDILWQGHNGIRNHEADRQFVANMRRMEWDAELADMAQYWMMQCQQMESDPCTEYEDRTGASYTRISQNVAFYRGKYLPQRFYYATLSEWFEDGSGLNMIEQQNLVWFNVSNRYTRMLWAGIWRIGCASGRYNDGFAVVCNYYGFNGIEQAAWIRSTPCTRCPRNLPICSVQFQNLCTADTAIMNRHGNTLITFIIISNVYYLFH